MLMQQIFFTIIFALMRSAITLFLTPLFCILLSAHILFNSTHTYAQPTNTDNYENLALFIISLAHVGTIQHIKKSYSHEPLPHEGALNFLDDSMRMLMTTSAIS